MENKTIILAIDDNLVQLKVFHNILVPKYDLRTVNSASAAINYLNANPADIILLDIEMPNISGFDFLTDIRRIPSYMSVPIIIISGKIGREFNEKARNSSAFEVLGKPVSAEILIDTIERAIARAE